MESFEGKLAVVTGGGSGMGRELVVQLAREGCSVAFCDLHVDSAEHTHALADDVATGGARVTHHLCDVSVEEQVVAFRDEVVDSHATDHVDLVFNNAGVGGGGSFVADDRTEWERTFGVCWWGVYHCSRAFVPLLVNSDDAWLVNTSSVNGFWASLGIGMPHTAYSTAKFAVRGFSESLIEDFRLNAPHVKVAVVMPGHIGTDIVHNTRRIHGDAPVPPEMGDYFRDHAPLTAAQAATIILDGVRAGRWRILVGDDAARIDEAVRADPEHAYDVDALRIIGNPT